MGVNIGREGRMEGYEVLHYVLGIRDIENGGILIFGEEGRKSAYMCRKYYVRDNEMTRYCTYGNRVI